ncbi:MAG: sugar transferase [Kiritimatiellaeota bacterium]|nr:sugar transferase [Kiritimatiellota bacterium]
MLLINSTDVGADPLAALRILAETPGDDIAIPAACLPVLTGPARLRPNGRGELAGYFIFPAAKTAHDIPPYSWMERFIAFQMLLSIAKLLVLIIFLVLAFDGRPVFFLQERYGAGGKPFRIMKFRTMHRRAPELHAKLQARKGPGDRPFKLAADPRVTRLGRFLRRWFLDELPQLWNIVCGDMRFVGPRPLPASDQAHYTEPCHLLRLNGKPGLTGLWQVSGRNARTFDEMCLLDVYYLCNRSLRFDLLILLRTLAVPFQK